MRRNLASYAAASLRDICAQEDNPQPEYAFPLGIRYHSFILTKIVTSGVFCEFSARVRDAI